MNDSTVSRADAVVIGAGIAGLVAARHLCLANLDVVVLEARHRVGGRLLSVPGQGVGLDLGATWFWPEERRVNQLIAELGLGTHSQYLSGDALYHSQAGVQRMQGNSLDVPSGRFLAGAQELAEAVARELPATVLRLDQPVTGIRATHSGLEVRTAHGAFAGSHVIIAVPPALAVSTMNFTPALPASLAALAQATPVWMGGITKIVACYASPFWRQAGLAGAGISHVGPIREVHDMSGPEGHPAALFGFVSQGSFAQPTVTETEVLAQLVEMFGAKAAAPEALLIQDWRQETYTSPPGVERLDNYEAFGHPLYATSALQGRLHWASTETATENPGHIEGALAAAERAARVIVTRSSRVNSPLMG